jgi:hypothetical protein
MLRMSNLLAVAFMGLGAAIGVFAQEKKAALPATAQPKAQESLPSWKDGPTKRAILDFVAKVTKEGGPHFVPPPEPIAVFDNDGTLWCEQPIVQVMFAVRRLKELLPKHPEWKARPALKAAIEGDMEYFEREGEQALMEVLAVTHSGMTVEEFDQAVAEFFKSAKHPKLDALYKDLAYQPMVELLRYLRTNGFTTWVCSGGGTDFMRVITPEIYGIPPEQVIGSIGGYEFVEREGGWHLVKTAKLMHYNDKLNKPVGIAIHVGSKPIFAAGNVRTGGDIAMLRYCQSNSRPSLQLMVNHDDAVREYSYGEKDNASLNAAKTGGWTVVSMKEDWKTIFPPKK